MTRRAECAEEKVAMRTIGEAEIAARRFSRELNTERKIAPTFYAYRCPSCHAYHLTHRAVWDGVPNALVHRAAPDELQRWAFPA